MARDGRALGALKEVMPESWKSVLAAFAAAYGTGLLALIALPFMVSANMRALGIDEAAAGILSSLEFIGVFITAVVFAPRMARVDRRKLAFCASLPGSVPGWHLPQGTPPSPTQGNRKGSLHG